MRVIKRDGSFQQFNVKKIKRALVMAFTETDVPLPNLNPLVNAVADMLAQGIELTGQVDIEVIQDAVERALMDNGHAKVAKAFILYRETRRLARDKRLSPDNSALAEYIHASKYARYRKDLGRRETYKETVSRVRDMHLKRFPNYPELINSAFSYVYQRKVMSSMRSMQFGGVAIKDQNARMFNCAATLIDRPEAFSHAFYLLLCGCGVGYSVQWEHINKLPMVSEKDEKVIHHHIADNIEGWADALHSLIYSAFNGLYVEFDYSQIRLEGTDLNISGGKAPGHLPLKIMLETVRVLLGNANGRKLRPIECHDIMCHVALAVLSGGIRRSSLISLFSADDTEMLFCKAKGSFRPAFGGDPGRNSHRQMANNSAVLLRSSTSRSTFDRIIQVAKENYGDPGFFFTNSIDHGTNPCGEIGLDPVLISPDGKSRETGFAFCNLCEINGALCYNEQDFYWACQAAAVIGTLQAAYTKFPYLGNASEKIAQRDSLLGVGIMGICNNPQLLLDPIVLRKGVELIKSTNERVARLIGINKAKRLTTIKPGGTAPLEASYDVLVSSGIHPHHSRRFFRRVTANANEPVAMEYKRNNPHQVETKPDGDWSITFPQQVSEQAITIKEQSAHDFLSTVFLVYDNWVKAGTVCGELTHSISATVTLRKDEDVLDMVWENRHRLQSLSFAPYLLDQIFPFAPRQEVIGPQDEALWNSLIENYKKVEWDKFKEDTDLTTKDPECSGKVCGGITKEEFAATIFP